MTAAPAPPGVNAAVPRIGAPQVHCETTAHRCILGWTGVALESAGWHHGCARHPKSLDVLDAIGIGADGAVRGVTIAPGFLSVEFLSVDALRERADSVDRAVRRWLRAGTGIPIATSGADVVMATAADCIDDDLSEILSQHSGSIEPVRASCDELEVVLAGACRGCPGASDTLTVRLTAAIEARLGRQIAIASENAARTRPAVFLPLNSMLSRIHPSKRKAVT